MTTVYIKWHGPYNLDNIPFREVAYSYGIYAIYQVVNGKEKLVYIGQTKRSFTERLMEHKKTWLLTLRGQIKIRMGILEFPLGERYSNKKLDDTEALLITTCQPPFNTTNYTYYYGRLDLQIINIGRRGLIDKNISTENLVWA